MNATETGVWDTSSMPLGFGFHPTDVELISHYLKRKIMGLNNEIEVIPEVDIYKYEPWELPAKTRIVSRDCKWHFFNTLDRKYPTGSRSNRATEAGYWKSTGKDRVIRSQNRVVGTKKTLVFHQGRPPHGKRTDWIMHEYFLDENERKSSKAKDIFVLCRVTKRNSMEHEDEEVYNGVKETTDDCALPKMLNDNCALPSSLTPNKTQEKVVEVSNAEDANCEAWVQELYDPDFGELPIPMAVCKVEIDEMNSNSLAPISELESSLLPPNVENVPSVNEEYSSYPEVQDYTMSLYEELYYFAQLEQEAMLDAQLREIQSPSIVEEWPIDRTIENEIHIGDSQTTNIDGNSNNRSKLQAHKMAQKNTEAVSYTVILENSNYHLDVNDYSEHVIGNKNAAYYDHGIAISNSKGRIFEEPEVQDPTTRRFRDGVKSLIRRALKDAHVIRRRHAHNSRRSMLINGLGGCLTGRIAVMTGLMEKV